MKIQNRTYENLTPEQRIIATMEAGNRSDEDEIRRLCTTCPRKVYEQPDAAFIDQWERIVSETLAIELDLAHIALTACLVEKQLGLKEAMNEAFFLQAMNEAVARWAEAKGVPRTTWEKFRPTQHPAVVFFLSLVPGPPAEGDVERILKEWREHDKT